MSLSDSTGPSANASAGPVDPGTVPGHGAVGFGGVVVRALVDDLGALGQGDEAVQKALGDQEAERRSRPRARPRASCPWAELPRRASTATSQTRPTSAADELGLSMGRRLVVQPAQRADRRRCASGFPEPSQCGFPPRQRSGRSRSRRTSRGRRPNRRGVSSTAPEKRRLGHVHGVGLAARRHAERPSVTPTGQGRKPCRSGDGAGRPAASRGRNHAESAWRGAAAPTRSPARRSRRSRPRPGARRRSGGGSLRGGGCSRYGPRSPGPRTRSARREGRSSCGCSHRG